MLTKTVNQPGSHRFLFGRLLSAILSLGFIGISGCQGDIQPVVVVRLSKLASSDNAVRFITSLDGALEHTTLFSTELSSRFGLRLPAGSKGTFSVTAEVLNTTNCVTSRGTNPSISVDGSQERVDADVIMFDVSPPKC